MINITKGNDFKLVATFKRGGEAFSFDGVSEVNIVYGLSKKTPLDFDYAEGKLTAKVGHEVPAGAYGLEVIGKEGDAVRRTAYNNVVSITNTTVAGSSFDPVDDIDDYDIGMHVELDMTVTKTTEKTDASTPSSSDSGTSEDTGKAAEGQ